MSEQETVALRRCEYATIEVGLISDSPFAKYPQRQ
jgi:hypothetical protein